MEAMGSQKKGQTRLLLSRWKIEEKEDRVITTLTTLSARNRRKIEGKLGSSNYFLII